MSLETHRHETLHQLRAFASSVEEPSFRHTDRSSAYEFFQRTLVRFRYKSLSKADKGAVRAYLAKVTGFSRAQTTRLIRQYVETGRIRDRRGTPERPFACRYTKEDIGCWPKSMRRWSRRAVTPRGQ